MPDTVLAPVSAETDVYSGDGQTEKQEEVKLTTFTEKELEAEVDRRITQARGTIYNKAKEEFEQNLLLKQKEAENKNLLENHKYKEVASKLQAELDAVKAEKMNSDKNLQVSKMLTEKNLGEYSELFLNNSSSIEEISEKINKFEIIQKQKIGEQVTQHLNVAPPLKSSSPAVSQSVLDLNSDQFAEYKKNRGIF